MADDVLNMLLARLDRLEAGQSTFNAPSWADIDQLNTRINKLSKDAELFKKGFDLVTQVLNENKADLAADRKSFHNRVIDVINSQAPQFADLLAHATNESEKHVTSLLRTEIGDATRAIARTAEQAEAAASANIKSAAAIIGAWASELGA